MVKTIRRYLFSSSRNKEANIGEDFKKKDSKFEQRERKYANTWGGGGRARGQKSPKALRLYSFCVYNNLFPLRFHFFALQKLQLN